MRTGCDAEENILTHVEEEWRKLRKTSNFRICTDNHTDYYQDYEIREGLIGGPYVTNWRANPVSSWFLPPTNPASLSPARLQPLFSPTVVSTKARGSQCLPRNYYTIQPWPTLSLPASQSGLSTSSYSIRFRKLEQNQIEPKDRGWGVGGSSRFDYGPGVSHSLPVNTSQRLR